MKIVHWISKLNFSSGGPPRAVIDLSTKLVEAGHEVKIVTCEDPDAPEAWRSNEAHNPCTVPVGPPHMLGFRLSQKQRGAAESAFEWADIVHAHGIWMPMTMTMCKLARRMQKPYVISLRGMLDDWCMEQRKPKKLVYLKLGGTKMLNSANLIHSTAEGELAQSKKWFPGSEGVVIPNLLNLEPFKSMPGTKLARDAFPMFGTGDPVLLYLSRLHYKKGVEHLINAIRLLRDEGNHHRLLIAGDGDSEYVQSLKRLVEQHGLQEHVAFLGLVVGDLKISLFQAADIFVLPTSQENFGFVIYESLAAGTPVVTTKGVDTWPELESGAGAVICDQDETELARSVSSLSARGSDLKVLGDQGRDWIFKEMSPDKILAQFEDLYRRATHEAKAQPF